MSVQKLFGRVKAKIATKITSKRDDFESLPGCLPDCPDCRWLRAHEQWLETHRSPIEPLASRAVDVDEALPRKRVLGAADLVHPDFFGDEADIPSREQS